MARIQVLHLPAPADEHPFALVVDQAGEDEAKADWPSFQQAAGAKAVLIVAGTLDVA